MSSINPLHSFSGYLQEALNGATQVDAQDNTLIGLKIAAKIVGQAALTLLSLIETVARYAIANGSWIISLALKDQQKKEFVANYVTPFFEHAKINKTVFFSIKENLTAVYTEHMKPFLEEKVATPAG